MIGRGVATAAGLGGNTSCTLKSTQYNPAALGTAARMASPMRRGGSSRRDHHGRSDGYPNWNPTGAGANASPQRRNFPTIASSDGKI